MPCFHVFTILSTHMFVAFHVHVYMFALSTGKILYYDTYTHTCLDFMCKRELSTQKCLFYPIFMYTYKIYAHAYSQPNTRNEQKLWKEHNFKSTCNVKFQLR